LEFRGALFESGWSVSLTDEIDGQFSIVRTPEGAERIFPVCLGAGPEAKALLLGAIPRAEVGPKENQKKGEKRQ
jgi:hypothetical protein